MLSQVLKNASHNSTTIDVSLLAQATVMLPLSFFQFFTLHSIYNIFLYKHRDYYFFNICNFDFIMSNTCEFSDTDVEMVEQF